MTQNEIKAVKNGKRQYLLVEPVSKTPYPPLGLMKISSMLKETDPGSEVFSQVGEVSPEGLRSPEKIYITSLFTWDLDKVIKVTKHLQWKYPSSEIMIGGIAASLMPQKIKDATGVMPHVGLLEEAEFRAPDYTLQFARKINTSITFASRGCIRKCQFCTVTTIEPEFFTKNNWEQDISPDLPMVTFWDNNWLASPNFKQDVEKLVALGKRVDFNQGIDARLYTKQKADLISKINIDPMRFAFDDIKSEKQVVNAIRLAKKCTSKEICVYVLYNFKDSPEEFFYKAKLLNAEGVLVFPMCYREPTSEKRVFPNEHWNSYLLRALKLSLMFYYRRGMITESRKSFTGIYGETYSDFESKLYEIYEYDKNLKRGGKSDTTGDPKN